MVRNNANPEKETKEGEHRAQNIKDLLILEAVVISLKNNIVNNENKIIYNIYFIYILYIFYIYFIYILYIFYI